MKIRLTVLMLCLFAAGTSYPNNDIWFECGQGKAEKPYKKYPRYMGYIHAFPKSAKQGKTSATMMLITGLDDGLTWSKYDAWFDPKRIHILKRNLYGEIMYTIDRESLDIDSPGGANYRCVLSSEDLVITKREEILNLQFDKNKI